MRVERMDISLLNHPEKNIRTHTQKQITEMVRSVKMFGQIRPVVIDESNTILAGNGLVMALREMGEEKVDVLRVTGLDEKKKKKLMIADNRIFTLGVDNMDVLDEFLEELSDDLDIPGFDMKVLEAMIGTAEEVTGMVMEYGKLDDKTIDTLRENGQRKEDEIKEVAADKGIDLADEGEYRPSVRCPKCGERIWL